MHCKKHLFFWYKPVIFGFLFFATTTFCCGQLLPVYSFQKDDSILKMEYYKQVLQKQNILINSLAKEHKDDYKEIYKSRFEQVSELLKSSRAVTSPEAHTYLQSVLKKITSVNPELKDLDARLLFSRDWWPNAYSMGEGTLIVNAGLMVFLDNEAELVFILCHELAHLYLDHGDKAIKKNVEMKNSEEFKKEVKKISKQKYNVNEKADELVKKLAFGSRRHSRDNEAEADKQAFLFMKKTGYDCNGIKTCLQMLDKVDDSLLYKPLDLEQAFNFKEYPFKKKWLQKESVIFGEMSDDGSPLTAMEKDSLKTHPDCEIRITLLDDSIKKISRGNKFLVNEKLFKQLKKDFFVEMAEQEFRDKNLTRNLYYNLLMLQNGDNIPVAVYSVARCLNTIYENQKNHQLGTMTDKEGKGLPEDYNLLLRMIEKLRLEDIAILNYYFCSQYQPQMKGYAGFDEEINRAKKIKNEY